MGRPIPKKFFGEDQIAVFAKIDSGGPATGFIVKQTGTTEFIVDVDGSKATCKLVNKESADLEVGEMIINVQNSEGEVSRVTKLTAHVVSTSDGTTAVWNTGNTETSPPLQISTTSEPIGSSSVTRYNATVDPMFQSGGHLLVGNSTQPTGFVITSDGVLEMAIDAKWYQVGETPPQTRGVYSIQLVDKATLNVSDYRRTDWNFCFSFGLLVNPDNKALTELYDITMEFKQGNTSIALLDMVLIGGTLHFKNSEGTIDISDSYVNNSRSILQNVQRIKWYGVPMVGTYSVILRATPVGGGETRVAGMTAIVTPPPIV